MTSRTAAHADGVVIVGGGLAGQRCAETLRRHGYARKITIVGKEPHQPYDRPPLSKELLAGTRSDRSLTYRPADWYAENEIELVLGVAAARLRVRERKLELANRSELRYDHLLIATGSRPRTLPQLGEWENVSLLRSLDDARILRDVLSSRLRLAVIGAGFIGQEVAATARRLGAEVTLIEAGSWPLAAMLGGAMGQWFARLHESEGVRVITATTVERILGDGRARWLGLSNGASVEVDYVVVGVGVEAEIDWLAGSPLPAHRGVPVDIAGRTIVDRVLAAGDAAASFDPVLGLHVPGSHWESAGRQGMRAARAMLGLQPGPVPVTSFWTDQYGMRIQYVGRASPTDDLTVEGDPAARNFSVKYNRDGEVRAVLLVNRPRALPTARKLIEKGAA